MLWYLIKAKLKIRAYQKRDHNSWLCEQSSKLDKGLIKLVHAHSSTPWVKPNLMLEETSSLEFNVDWSLIKCWEATHKWSLVALFVMLKNEVVE